MTHQISEAEFEGLRKTFHGDIITPTDWSYDEVRTVYNAMIERWPGAIAQCTDVNDVVSAVQFARERDLEVAVRGGGHSVAGNALTNDGLVIDLRRMHTVVVDPLARTATVAGGATMAQLDQATAVHGLATTGGRVSSTGVGGFTLGGGSGWLERKFGLACDNLLSVQLVTADGRVLVASDTEHPELFWALHGGGGNFGVVTAFTFQLHALPALTIAFLLWPPEAAPKVLRVYRDFMAAAPDEVGGAAFFLTGPAEPFVPPSLVGQLAFGVLVVYTGREAEAREVAAGMLALGHTGGLVTEMPYAKLQCMVDNPPGLRNHWSADYLDALPDKAIDLFCARAQDMVVPSASLHVLLPQGGAVGRGPVHYPLPWRGAPWVVHPLGLWQDPADDARARQWAHDLRADLQPWASGAVYLNFIGDEGEDRVQAGFGRDNYARLAKVKAQYDPQNFFHLNHNIKPWTG